MSTPHIEVNDKSLFAETVLMPGDPLRAEFIANKFLENPVKINNVRNMYAFTGTYHGKKVTVMGSGMGMPSIGIYSYELFKFYDVKTIIRIGSAGSYVKELDVYDVVIADGAYSESTYAKVAFGFNDDIMKPTDKLNETLKQSAKKLGIPLHEALVHSSDVFYREHGDIYRDVVDKYHTSCVEMESYSLFANAKALGKNAACLLTISDSFVTHAETTSEQRRSKLMQMVEIALDTAATL